MCATHCQSRRSWGCQSSARLLRKSQCKQSLVRLPLVSARREGMHGVARPRRTRTAAKRRGGRGRAKRGAGGPRGAESCGRLAKHGAARCAAQRAWQTGASQRYNGRDVSPRAHAPHTHRSGPPAYFDRESTCRQSRDRRRPGCSCHQNRWCSRQNLCYRRGPCHLPRMPAGPFQSRLDKVALRYLLRQVC